MLIPTIWVQAAVDAHIKLNIQPTGGKYAALDIGDQGADRNAFCGRHGILLERICSWSGKNSDIFATVVRAFGLCGEGGYQSLYYDSDGLGAAVLGDSRIVNKQRAAANQPSIIATPFRGSAAVWSPRSEMVPGRTNEDYFANLKAQSWMALRLRFHATYRALQGQPFQADDLISISSSCGELNTLILELSQPTYHVNAAGKILVDKTPDGARSPNLADSCMICFSPATRFLELWVRLGQ